MRGLYIVVEGPTEEEFVNELIAEYFQMLGIFDVRPILLSTSKGHKGGAISYDRFRNNVRNLLKRERDVVVTSLIDFYKLDTSFPDFDRCGAIPDKIERVSALEGSILNEINDNRFLPYIQLHEFEGLLFADDRGFSYFDSISDDNLQELRETVIAFNNPELINDGTHTAPSKRLLRLIPGYRKTLHGPIIALENTFPVLMERCVRFRAWIQTLTQMMRSEIYN